MLVYDLPDLIHNGNDPGDETDHSRYEHESAHNLPPFMGHPIKKGILYPPSI